MAKFCDVVGYVESTESAPGSGVWKDVPTERKLYGDVLRNSRQLEQVEQHVNADITVGNSISVVADAYALEHFHAIRYVRWAGARWSVTNIDVQAPRLVLRLGGVYNGPTPPTPG